MNHRRIAGVVVIVALLGLAFPTAGEAARSEFGVISEAPGLLERVAAVWSWVQGVMADLGTHVAKDTASITGSG